MVPVTFGHPWRSCCFCLEKCPGLWLLVVSLGGLQRPKRRARHRRSSRAELPSSWAEIIPGPVGLNGGPRHRRSGPSGAATRARHRRRRCSNSGPPISDGPGPARSPRVPGRARSSVCDGPELRHRQTDRRSEFIYKISSG
jgi:hypothetical protein